MTYSTVRRLGRGGMGVVDLAVTGDGRHVAVKRLALHGSATEMHRARQRVRREAAALAALDHPGIVRLLDVVDDGDEIVLVMPYLSGGTLADGVRAFGPMPAARVHDLADALLDALAAAHRAGIVHRDIKPANVLFDQQGRPYLADFGIALMRDATSGLTVTEALVGTPEYMSPEQARGEKATAASDVFSLGATLRYAATGDPPFGRGDPRVIVHRAAAGRLDRLPPGLPRDLRDRLVPLLERRPERRPTAAAARAGGVTRRLPRPPQRRTPAPGARLWPAVAGISLIAVAALTATTFMVLRHRSGTSAAGASTATSTTVACTPLAYQPCGRPPAAFTDGTHCIDQHDDYDQDPTNGCEAAPDPVSGVTFDHPITANLVPAAEVDRYPFHLTDHLQLLCHGSVAVSLTAPARSSMRLDILDGTTLLGTAVSTDGTAAVVTLDDPSCLGDDSADLVAQVSWAGTTRTADSYHLERTGTY